MSSTKITVPGEVAVSSVVDTTGETIARGGVRLMSVSGPQVLSGSGDPNDPPGLSAPRGSLYVRTDTAQLWQNTSALSTGTTWSQVGAGGGSFSGVAAYSTTELPNNNWISFNTEIYDTDSYHSNADPTRFFVPTTGYYHITSGSIRTPASDPGGFERVIGIVRTSGVADYTLRESGARETNWIESSVTSYLLAGDVIRTYASTYPAGTWLCSASVRFCMEKVG